MRDNERQYLWPSLWVRDVVLDAVELQKAEILFDDMEAGVTHYIVTMYGIAREFCITVIPLYRDRSRVRIEVSGAGEPDVSYAIYRQFALFENLMAGFEMRRGCGSTQTQE